MAPSDFKPSIWFYDRRTGVQRLLHAVERYGQAVFLSFKHPQTGAVERQPFVLAKAESRFDALTGPSAAFRGNPEAVTLFTEAYRLQHAYLFNPLHLRL